MKLGKTTKQRREELEAFIAAHKQPTTTRKFAFLPVETNSGRKIWWEWYNQVVTVTTYNWYAEYTIHKWNEEI